MNLNYTIGCRLCHKKQKIVIGVSLLMLLTSFITNRLNEILSLLHILNAMATIISMTVSVITDSIRLPEILHCIKFIQFLVLVDGIEFAFADIA